MLGLDIVFLILCFGMLGLPAVLGGYLLWGIVRHVRTRTKPRAGALVFLGLGLLALGAWIVLLVLEEQDLYIYLGGKLSPDWRRGLCWFFPPLLGIGVILFSARRIRSAATAGWSAVLAVALVCIFFVLGFQTAMDTEHTMVSSPDVAGETHEILFVETSLLLGGRYTVYERISPGVVYYLGSYTTDDGETPVTDGRYMIDWREDGFAFTGGLAKEKFFPYAP